MIHALTHVPSTRMAECELTFIDAEPIDPVRARAQHAAYVAALEALGARVEVVETHPECPDSVFIEDRAIVLDEIAITTSMGSVERRAELSGMDELLAPYRSIAAIEPPGRLEGGDVLRMGRTLFVGASCRTDAEGITHLAHCVEPFGYHVEPVPVFGCLHLKTGVTALDEGTVVINPDWVDESAFAGLRRIRVDPHEPWAANTLTLGGTTLVQEGQAQTVRQIERAGFPTRAVDISEFARAEGGLTCLSLIFEGGGGGWSTATGDTP